MTLLGKQPLDTENATGPASLPPVSLQAVLVGAAVRSTDGGSQEGTGVDVAFRLLEPIGEGAMGVVYRAEQRFPPRIVALKVLKRLANRSPARFDREVASLARLHHRGIATLYAAGVLQEPGINSSASPFMAMEYVDGEPLTTYSRQQNLGIKESIRLFLKVCEAVEHAHAEGVIHRDLKPSNILVDQQGEPHILDFGLASIRQDTMAASGPLTIDGQLVGTPEYMSPEQAAGLLSSVDGQSDVYSLGVMLYELLTGKRLHDFSSCEIIEALRVVQHSSAPLLSTNCMALRGDLEIIVAKALSNGKELRYRSVADFSADLRHYLANEPIAARRPSLGYKTRKFIHRHTRAMALAIITIGALTTGAILLHRAMVSEQNETVRATEAERLSKIRTQHARLAAADMLMLAGRFTEARNTYDAVWDELDKLGASSLAAQLGIWELDQSGARPIRIVDEGQTAYSVFTFSDDQQQVALGSDYGHVEVRDVLFNSRRFSLEVPGNVHHLLLEPGGQRLLVFGDDLLEAWDLRSSQRLVSRKLDCREDVSPIIWRGHLCYATKGGDVRIESMDGSIIISVATPAQRGQLALASSPDGPIYLDRQGVLRQFSPTSSSWITRATLVMPRELDRITMSPSGHYVAWLTRDELVVVDLKTQLETFRCKGFSAQFLAFCDNDKFVVSHFSPPVMQVLNPEGKILRQLTMDGTVYGHMDKDLAILANSKGPCTLWSLHTPPGLRRWMSSNVRESGMALSGNGTITAIPMDEKTVTILDHLGSELGRVNMGGRGARCLGLDFAGHRLATLTSDQRLELWNLESWTKEGDERLEYPPNALAISQDGNTIAAGLFFPGSVKIRHRMDGKWTPIELPTKDLIGNIDLTAGGDLCVAIGNTSASLWKVDDPGKPLWEMSLPEESQQRSISFVQGGKGFAFNAEAATISLWDTATRTRSAQLPACAGPIRSIQGGRGDVLIATDDREVYLFDLNTCELLRRMPLPIPMARRARASTNGMQVLFSARNAGAVKLDFSLPSRLHGSVDARMSPAAQVQWFVDAGLDHVIPSDVRSSLSTRTSSLSTSP